MLHEYHEPPTRPSPMTPSLDNVSSSLADHMMLDSLYPIPIPPAQPPSLPTLTMTTRS